MKFLNTHCNNDYDYNQIINAQGLSARLDYFGKKIFNYIYNY